MAILADRRVEAQTTRVLIVAAFASARAGLRALLDGAESLAVAGDVGVSGDSHLARIMGAARPDVVLLEGASDGEFGLVLGALRSASLADTAVVVLGDNPEAHLPRLAGAALPGFAYLLRDADGPQISRAIAAAHSGLVVLDRSLSRLLETSALPQRIEADRDGDTLTPREIEVLALMAEGLPNKIIASRLKITLHTAKFHVAQILSKLGAASRTEAVTMGARRGFVLL